MEQNENQDSIRERIRTYAFDLKLPLIRRDIDLLIQQGLDEQWNLWMFTAELLRREKENRSENQRRHRIKNAAFPQLRYLNEIDTDALPPEARKALPNLETLDFIKEGRNPIRESRYRKDPSGYSLGDCDLQRGILRTVHFRAQTAYADKGMQERNDTKGAREQVRTIRHGHLRRVRIRFL